MDMEGLCFWTLPYRPFLLALWGSEPSIISSTKTKYISFGILTIIVCGTFTRLILLSQNFLFCGNILSEINRVEITS